MDSTQWKEAILASVERLASAEYQERAWFNRSNEVSSPDEMFSELFDDLSFGDFLTSKNIELTGRQRELADKLRVEMDIYADQTEPTLDPRKVICDPSWLQIRDTAARFSNAMKEPS